MIEWILAVLLLFSAALITYGCWLISHPSGFIVGGILLAAISVLYLLETS